MNHSKKNYIQNLMVVLVTAAVMLMLLVVGMDRPMVAVHAAEHVASIRTSAEDGVVKVLESLTLYAQLDGVDVKESDGYTVSWQYEDIKYQDIEFATGVSYTYPVYYEHMASPFCVITDSQGNEYKSEGLSIGVERDRDVASVVMNNKPVFPGTTVEGATLSADGQTLTIDGVNLTDYESGDWDNAGLFIDAESDQFNFVIKGDNAITSVAEAYGVSGNFSYNTDVVVKGGGTLNVTTTAGSFYFGEMINSEATRHTNILITDGVTLNCIVSNPGGTPKDIYYNEAIELTGQVTLDNVTIYAESDGRFALGMFRNDKTDVEQAKVKIINSMINCIDSCAMQNAESAEATTYAAAIVITSPDIVIDHSVINATNVCQDAEESFAIRMIFADLEIKNGSVINSECKYAEYDSDVEQGIILSALMCPTISIDDSTVKCKVSGNVGAASYGVIFSQELKMSNNANLIIDVDTENEFSQGIKYYGTMTDPNADSGIIDVTDSNMTVNVTGTINDNNFDPVIGIGGRELSVNLSSEKYAVTINTENLGTTGSYGVLMFDIGELGTNIFLGDSTTINTPQNAMIADFQYGKYTAYSITDSAQAEKAAGNVVIAGNSKTDPVIIYTVTAGVDGNGTITPSGSNTVKAGESITFTAKAEDGYKFIGWNVNDTYINTTELTYAVENVDGDIKINALFEKETADPSPATGDTAPIGLYVLMVILGMMSVVVACAKSGKKKA